MIENYEGLQYSERQVVSWTVLKASMAPRGRFLCIGPEAVALAESMVGAGSKGVVVTQNDESFGFNCDVLRCVIGPDSRFVKTVGGWWTRVVTMREIFNQFGVEWFDVVCIMGTGRDRELWETPQVQAVLPSVYVIPEDGHNEGVIKTAVDRGYECIVCADALVMVHR